TSAAIGRYRAKKVNSAIRPNPRCARMSKVRRTLAIVHLRSRDVADVEQQGDHYQRHERDRYRRPERPVSACAELQFDQVAEHHVLAAAQHARDDISSDRKSTRLNSSH